MWLGRPLGSSYPSPLAQRDRNFKIISSALVNSANGFDWDLQYTSRDDGYISQPDTSTKDSFLHKGEVELIKPNLEFI